MTGGGGVMGGGGGDSTHHSERRTWDPGFTEFVCEIKPAQTTGLASGACMTHSGRFVVAGMMWSVVVSPFTGEVLIKCKQSTD